MSEVDLTISILQIVLVLLNIILSYITKKKLMNETNYVIKLDNRVKKFKRLYKSVSGSLCISNSSDHSEKQRNSEDEDKENYSANV